MNKRDELIPVHVSWTLELIADFAFRQLQCDNTGVHCEWISHALVEARPMELLRILSELNPASVVAISGIFAMSDRIVSSECSNNSGVNRFQAGTDLNARFSRANRESLLQSFNEVALASEMTIEDYNLLSLQIASMPAIQLVDVLRALQPAIPAAVKELAALSWRIVGNEFRDDDAIVREACSSLIHLINGYRRATLSFGKYLFDLKDE